MEDSGHKQNRAQVVKISLATAKDTVWRTKSGAASAEDVEIKKNKRDLVSSS